MGWLAARHPVRDSNSRRSLQGLSFSKAVGDLGKGCLPLPLYGGVNEGLGKTFRPEHRRVPTTPYDREVGAGSLGGARHGEGVTNRRTAKDGDSQAQGPVERLHDGPDRVLHQTAVDQAWIVNVGVEMGCNRLQGERHGVEHRPRIVKDNLVADRVAGRGHGTLCPL